MYDCSLEFIQAIAGEHSLGFVPPNEIGNSLTGEPCHIYVARQRDHNFVQTYIVAHEVAHCYGWTHGPGEAFHFPRR